MDLSFRYVLRTVVGPLLIITAAVCAIVWLSQSLRLIDFVVNRGLPVYYILWMSLLMLPPILSGVLPVTQFIAVISAYTKLSRDSEFVILKAAGKSDLSISAPALSLAVMVTVLIYVVNIYVLPSSARAFREIQDGIRKDYSSIVLEEGAFTQVSPGMTVYIAARETDGTLSGLLIHDSRIPDNPVTIIAERGQNIRSQDGLPRILLTNGSRQSVNRVRDQLSLLYFDQYTLDLSSSQRDDSLRFRNADERSLKELFWPGNSPDELKNADRFRAQGHQRLASPLLAIAFTLIGALCVLGGGFDRRGQNKRILTAIFAVTLLQCANLGIVFGLPLLGFLTPILYLLPITAIAALAWQLYRPMQPIGMLFMFIGRADRAVSAFE